MNWKIASIFSKTPVNNGYMIQKVCWWVFPLSWNANTVYVWSRKGHISLRNNGRKTRSNYRRPKSSCCIICMVHLLSMCTWSKPRCSRHQQRVCSWHKQPKCWQVGSWYDRSTGLLSSSASSASVLELIFSHVLIFFNCITLWSVLTRCSPIGCRLSQHSLPV